LKRKDATEILFAFWRGDPTLTDDSFKNEKSLSSIAKRTGIALGEVFSDFVIERIRITAGTKWFLT